MHISPWRQQSIFLEKLDQGSLDQGSLDHWIEDRGSRIENRGSRIEDRGSRIEDRGSRIKNQGLAQNESNKLNKLIGMIDCLST